MRSDENGANTGGSAFGEQAREREAMVRDQIEGRGIKDPNVLRAMRRVPRHAFLSGWQRRSAYADHPLPIGCGQTISQPYIVALMTASLEPQPGDRILEIGAGCGYQTAVLLECGATVFAIEYEPQLADLARRNLRQLGYEGVEVRTGDGSGGWPEHAPFDGILAAAAAPRLPEGLTGQLAPRGRLLLPIGTGSQTLTRYERTPSGIEKSDLGAVRFVPLHMRPPGGDPQRTEPYPP